MTTVVSLLTVGACYRLGVKYPEWRVSIWIALAVAVFSWTAEMVLR